MNSFRTRERVAGRSSAATPTSPSTGCRWTSCRTPSPSCAPTTSPRSTWPEDPELEWCPPGHGDIYVALATTGLLDALRDKGFRYAFLSNADNLGATCERAIAGVDGREGIPYVAEVCDRTRNDRKGGHLAVRKSDGRLVLRDSAMVAEGEDHYFQDTERHPLFHANNLWVDLDALAARHGPSATASSACRSSSTARPSTRPARQSRRSSRSSRPWGRPSRSSTARARSPCPQPVPSGEDDQRAAAHPLRHLSARRRVHSCRRSTTTSRSSTWRSPTSWCGAFEQRFPVGCRRSRGCSSLRVEGDMTFGADVVCTGDVPSGLGARDGPRRRRRPTSRATSDADPRRAPLRRARLVAAAGRHHRSRWPAPRTGALPRT